MRATYKDSGVDVALGDKCSKLMYEASKKTWANRKGLLGQISTPVDDFSALRFADISGLKDTAMQMNFDSIGTKTEVAERLSCDGDFSFHQGMAFDLFAMVCDDAAAKGGEPVMVGSILEVNKLNSELVSVLARGMVKAAKASRVAVVNGEIAEVGSRVCGYGKYNYNWGATALWMAKKGKLITGRQVKPGHRIIGFREKGFRSNGFSLARKIMSERFGEDWHKDKQKAIALLTPSTIYCRTIVDCIAAGAQISAIAHITGGGLYGKLARALKISKLGASIFDHFAPNPLMLKLQEAGGVQDREAYNTWNMGVGMAVITSNPEPIINQAIKDGIEAKLIGEVMEEPEIKIKNKGFFAKEKELVF